MLYLFFVFIDMHQVFFLHHAFIIFLTFIEADSVILQNMFNPLFISFSYSADSFHLSVLSFA